MRLDESLDQQTLRNELRAYFAELLTDDVREELRVAGESAEPFRTLVRRMGADGWLGIGWPKEYGGQGRPPSDQYVFFDEVQRAGAPFPFVTLNTVGPTIMLYGTEAQKAAYLPGILRGEVNFAIGYTESEAGTDLASLRTKAVRDGDEYVVDGAKVFTSGANQADDVWLACRTDADAPKHRGISIIIVPTTAPGFSWTPIETVGGVVTTATFYDDVRVPTGNRVGPENEGWRMITTQLNHERVGLAAYSGLATRLMEEVRGLASTHGLLDEEWVRLDLAQVHARMQAMRLLNWRMAQRMTEGTLSPADSSAVKVFGTEGLIEVYRLLLGIVGPVGSVRAGSASAVLAGDLERAMRAAQINTFGGGVNEVQREIVAAVGLGMARQSR